MNPLTTKNTPTTYHDELVCADPNWDHVRRCAWALLADLGWPGPVPARERTPPSYA